MCVLNCKALMPTPHVPLFALITNHYSRWRGSVLGRNEVPRVGYCLLFFGVLQLHLHLCRLTCLKEVSIQSWHP